MQAVADMPDAWHAGARALSWSLLEHNDECDAPFSSGHHDCTSMRHYRHQKGELLAEFNAGVSHLSFYMVLELSHFGEDPWMLLQMAHFELDIAHRAARACLEFPASHPRLRRLQQLRPLVEAWFDGRSLSFAHSSESSASP